MTESQRLLADYVSRRSEDAFSELVNRYLDLVYSVALRVVGGDALLAEEAAQTVFLDLARTAESLAQSVALGGWLHRHAFYVASKLIRSQRRRQRREREAAEMNAVLDHSDANFAEITPLLDRAIERLKAEDRTAIVLRFFEQLDFRSLGEALGTSEGAAQKRVERALSKLHELLRRSGCTLSVAGLGAALVTGAVAAAPAELAGAISATAFAGTALGTTAGSVTFIKTIAMSTLQNVSILAGAAVLAGTALYQARQASRLTGQVQTLRQHQAVAGERIQQLARERDAATNLLSGVSDQLTEARSNTSELMKLRAELARLRAQDPVTAEATQDRVVPTEEEAWLTRVQVLRQRMSESPQEQIPELQFLDTEDWLIVAKLRNPQTDADFRAAFGDLRSRAEGNFLGLAEKALRNYLAANSDKFPANVADLKPYFETVPEELILHRYEIVRREVLPQAAIGGDPNDWIIKAKNPTSGSIWTVGAAGRSGYANLPALDTLAPAIQALLEATPTVNGRKQMDIHDLGPYLTTPELKAAYEELVRGRK
ncbi:MAG: sigma-70 family RNA polymerase sigma factor [Verrucomicrobiota bacterium]